MWLTVGYIYECPLPPTTRNLHYNVVLEQSVTIAQPIHHCLLGNQTHVGDKARPPVMASTHLSDASRPEIAGTWR